MKFSTRQDIDVPAHRVFSRATEYARFERLIQRRGIALRRISDCSETGAGPAWAAELTYRGHSRAVDAAMYAVEPNQHLAVKGATSGVDFVLTMDIVELSLTKSRMIFGLDLRPATLPARLMVQSLRLNKATLDRKFAERVSKFVQLVQKSG